MMNPIGLGLAMAATASLGFAGTNGDPTKKGDPLLDSLFQSNITVTYKPGGGVTFDGGKEFSLNIGGRLQAKWYYTSLENAADTNTFLVRAARLTFGGHVWSEDITYLLQLENAMAPGVLDAVVGWNFWSNDDAYAGLSMGLQKFPGGLQWGSNIGTLEINERSIASATFSSARATGALVHGGFGKMNDGHSFRWHAGLSNHDTAGGAATSALGPVNESNELDIHLGAVWAGEGTAVYDRTEGDLAHNGKLDPLVGVNVLLGSDRVGGVEIDTTSINAFAGAKFGQGVAAQAEVFIRSDEPTGGATADSMGWYVQGSYTTAPGSGTQWGFAGRVAMVDMEDANPILFPVSSLGTSGAAMAGFVTGTVLEISGALSAYYHEHKLKSQVAVTYQSIDADTGAGTDSDNLGIDVMATLWF